MLLSPGAFIPPFTLSLLPFAFIYLPLGFFFSMNKTMTVYSFHSILAVPGFVFSSYSSSTVILGFFQAALW